jgi:hypothetical protein
MKNYKTIKVNEDFYNFLIKLGSNRIKKDMELKTLSIPELASIIAKYFKSDNNSYLELVKTEIKKNGIK